MDKKKIIEELEIGLNLEEKSLKIYSKHLKNSLFLSSINNAEQDKIKQILKMLEIDSLEHKHSLETIIRDIENGVYNV